VSIPIVAPYLPSYATRESYITPAEFLADATGVTVSSLVPGGTPAQNADALASKLLQASGAADSFCHQVLAATVEVESDMYRYQGGQICIPVRQTPIIQVNSISTGQPGFLVPMADMSAIQIDRKVVNVPILPAWSGSPVQPSWLDRRGRLQAVMTYVAGYANTVLAVASAAGATTLVLADTVGMVPGLGLTVGDPGAIEVVIILSIAGNTITCAATRFAHPAGAGLSALPPAVKSAVSIFATALIRNRGTDATVLHTMRATPDAKTQMLSPSSRSMILTAQDMLIPFVAVP
jgi:hypothetical protein